MSSSALTGAVRTPPHPPGASRPRRSDAGVSDRPVGQLAGLDRQPDRARHRHGIVSTGDRTRAEHSVAAQLERQHGVGCRAHPGIEDHRHLGLLDDDRDVVRVADAHSRADRRTQWHHRGATDVLQPARQNRVVGGVGEHYEAVVDQRLGGRHQLDRVRKQRAVIPDHLELDPFGLEGFAGQLGGDDRVARGEAPRRVRQHVDPRVTQDVEDRPPRGGIEPAQRNGADLGSRGGERGTQQLVVREAAGSQQQSGAKLAPRDNEWLQRPVHPPCTATTTSTWAPSRSAGLGPCLPRHDLTVDGDGDPAAFGATSSERISAATVSLSATGALLPVDEHPHAPTATRAKRAGANGLACPGSGSPRSPATTSSAVIGASRMPLRKCPTAQCRPSTRRDR